MFANLFLYALALVQVATALPIQKRQSFSGDATYYATGLGACGWVNNDSQYIVAMNQAQYSSGAHCGNMITITHNGKSATAQVVDLCPGCSYGSLDMSPSLFTFFEDEGVGRFQMSWVFGSSGGETQPTTTETTTTPTYTPTQTTPTYTPTETSTYVPPTTTTTTTDSWTQTTTTTTTPAVTSSAAAVTPSSAAATSASASASAAAASASTTSAAASASTARASTSATHAKSAAVAAASAGTLDSTQSSTNATESEGNLALVNEFVASLGRLVAVSA